MTTNSLVLEFSAWLSTVGGLYTTTTSLSSNKVIKSSQSLADVSDTGVDVDVDADDADAMTASSSGFDCIDAGSKLTE